jgi:predicted PurR-regulated permease PerM
VEVQHLDGPRHVGDLALDDGQTALAPWHDHEPLRIRPARDGNQERLGARPRIRRSERRVHEQADEGAAVGCLVLDELVVERATSESSREHLRDRPDDVGVKKRHATRGELLEAANRVELPGPSVDLHGTRALPGDEIRLVSERWVQEDDRRRRAQRRDQQGSGRHARRGALGARMDHGVEILQAAFRGRSVARIWFHAPLGAPELGRGPGPTCPRVPTSESRLEDVKSAAAIPPDRHTRQRERVQRRGLVWAAAAAIVAIGWIAHPLATGLFLGALMGFALEPLYEALRRRKSRPQLASLATVSIAVIGILGAVAGFVSLFVTRGVALAGVLATALGPGGSLTPWAHSAIELLARLGFSTGNLTDRLRDAATGIASQSATFAAAGFSATASTLLGCFFALLAMHATLLYWSRAVATFEAVLPLRPEHTRALLAAFRRAGRATLLGTVVTGATQGVLAGVGYWVTGVPEPAFFGIATAIASVVPAVGTLLVWVPAGLYLVLSGHLAWGIVELAWGLLVVVGFGDYVIRPRLVGDEDMPLLLTFLALFGGLEVLGMAGLLVGPVVVSVAVVALRLYAREMQVNRSVP